MRTPKLRTIEPTDSGDTIDVVVTGSDNGDPEGLLKVSLKATYKDEAGTHEILDRTKEVTASGSTFSAAFSFPDPSKNAKDEFTFIARLIQHGVQIDSLRVVITV